MRITSNPCEVTGPFHEEAYTTVVTPGGERSPAEPAVVERVTPGPVPAAPVR